jgi:tRNA nucleotidyltransferase/poly(A) polymerase
MMEGDVESRALPLRVLELVEAAGFQAALVGGWGRELLGLEPPRPHSDIDLVVTDADVTQLDAWLNTQDEFPAKRFPHKRAFRLAGVMVELHLVRRTSG